MENVTTSPMPEYGNWTKEQDENTIVEGYENRTIEELAETYAIYSAALWISKYYVPVLVPFGLVGNTLSFMVMTMPHNRANSCCNLMAALSISDNCMMLVSVYIWLMTSGFFRPATFYECKFIAYSFNLFAILGIYLIVFMTFDRCTAVVFPLRMTQVCTVRRARGIIIGVCVGALLYTLSFLHPSGIINKRLCSSIKTNTTFTITLSWINALVSCAIPFISLLVMNILIIKTLVARQANLKHLNRNIFTRSRRNSDAQLATMLILVSLALLILTLPVCIRYIMAITLDYENNPYHCALYTFVYHLSQKFYFTNSAVNFYLYCIGGTKFRTDLTRLCSRNNNASIVSNKSDGNLASLMNGEGSMRMSVEHSVTCRKN